ncbi:hypothetical protein ZWY2020_016324 [Hordeum vulgare]|nr:hypothetical protein ZWY2020_016324 [Hordeum vulgare]
MVLMKMPFVSESPLLHPYIQNSIASIYDILEMAFSLLPCFDSTLSALLEEEQNVCPDTKLIPRINETLAAPGYYQAANGEVSIEQFGQPRLPQSIDEPLLAMQMSSTAPISMPLAPGCDEECLTTALTRGYMSLDSALYPQTGAMIPSYNTEASKLGFFNGSGGNSNGMVVLDMNDIGEYQRMIEGEGLARTYSDTDSMQGGYSNTAEIQYPRDTIHSFIKTSNQHNENRICQKQTMFTRGFSQNSKYYGGTSLKHLKSSNNFRVKLKIIIARRSSSYDLIEGVNI